MKIKLILIGLLALISACSKNTLILGTYVQKPDVKIIRWTNEEFKFLSENRFEYTYLSDDLTSSKHGAGIFKIKNDKLQMEFSNEPLESPKSVVISKEIQQADSSQNIFQIHVKTHKGVNLDGANIMLIDANQEGIFATTDLNGKAELKLPKESNPTLFKLSSLGFESMVYELPKNRNLSIEVTLSENFSTQITNKRMERKIKIKKDYIIIDGKEYQVSTFANKS
jgi:rRNA maturation protein Rpf1